MLLSPVVGLSQKVADDQLSIISVAGQFATDFGLKEKVNTFMKGMPIFMKALDEVGKLHPIVQGMRSFPFRNDDRVLNAHR